MRKAGSKAKRIPQLSFKNYVTLQRERWKHLKGSQERGPGGYPNVAPEPRLLRRPLKGVSGVRGSWGAGEPPWGAGRQGAGSPTLHCAVPAPFEVIVVLASCRCCSRNGSQGRSSLLTGPHEPWKLREDCGRRAALSRPPRRLLRNLRYPGGGLRARLINASAVARAN